MRRGTLRKQWAAQASISVARDRELVRAAADSGCFGLLIGIESVTRDGFRRYAKSVGGMAELRRAVAILKDHGIGVDAHLVFGNDFDTPATMAESLENLLRLDFVTASLNILVPYPGTRVNAELEKQRRIFSKDWDYYDINHLVFQPRNFSREGFLEAMRRLRRRFFSTRAVAGRVLSFARVRPLTTLGLNIVSRSHNAVGFPES